MMLRVCLFGQPCFFWDAQPLKYSAPPRALPLLGYLLLHRDRPVERLYLASLLWPDDAEADARANLRRHLHHLNSFLPEPPGDTPWLLTDELTVQWNPAADCWLDVAEFERLSVLPGDLAGAVALYSGDFLETLYDDWVIVERERLREQYFNVLMQLALDSRARCDYAQASAFTAQLLARDPLREDALRLHITLHYQVGDRAGAIQAYEKFQRLLRQELGVEPMPETQAVIEAILRNRSLPAVGPVISEMVGQPCRALSLPWVGRQSEMAQIEAAWRRARQGSGALMWVSGVAGIGKTRLVREFAQFAETQGGRVLYGNTTPTETAPYQAVREALLAGLPLLAAVEVEPIWLAALAVLIPELHQRHRPTLPALPDLDEKNQRTRLFEGLLQTLRELARPRPLLLILEDLHWAGGGTLALLEHLARQVGQTPILILATYREEELGHEHPLSLLRRRLQDAGLAEQLALSRLSVGAVESLLGCLSTPYDVQLAQPLHTQCGGIPLYLELLLRQWPGESPDLAALQAVPTDLTAMIQRRLEHLSADALALAEVAAAAGPAFEFELVRTVGGWGEGQALDALGELLDQHLVCESPGRSRFDYSFDHHLVQAAIYSATPPITRRRRHRRMAQVMEKFYPPVDDTFASEIGSHYERGGEVELAAGYYLRAIRHSLALYADDEALAHAARALPLAAAPGLRWDILAQREAIYHRRGERVLQKADLEQMTQLAESLDDPQQACEVLRRRILYHRALSERPAEAALLAELKVRTEEMGDLHWQAVALSSEATYLSLVGRFEDCKAVLERALVNYQSLGDVAGQVDCYCQLGHRAMRAGQHGQIPGLLAPARALAEAQQDVILAIKILRLEERAAYMRGDFADAYAISQQSLQRYRRIGDRGGELDMLVTLALIASRLFRIDETIQRYAEAETLSIGLGNRDAQAGLLNNQGIFYDRLGRHAEGLQIHRRALEIFRAMGNLYGQTLSLLNIGNALANLEDYPQAKEYALQALALAGDNKGTQARVLGLLGTIERELGELEQSVMHIQDGLSIRRSANLSLEWNLSELALTYLRLGALAEAQQAADQALACWETNTGPLMHYQKDLWVAAQVYQAAGDAERSRQLLVQAYEVMQGLASEIPEAEMRAAFLQVSHNRQIAAAYRRANC